MTHRRMKRTVADLLLAAGFEESLAELCRMPARQVVNPLFGLLYSGDPLMRWHAVSGMGAVVSNLADHNIESARIIMRRFMWNLNDESGGIGWGSPEAMGDIMARSPRLAGEFAAILVSYADPNGNYLEHPGLQPGVLWALGRLGRVHPDLVVPAIPLLVPYMASPVPDLRGLSLWAASALPLKPRQLDVASLADDAEVITIYADGDFSQCSVGQLARRLLSTDSTSEK